MSALFTNHYPDVWLAALSSAGFMRDNGVFRHPNGLVAALDDQWVTFHTKAISAESPGNALGLWKRLSGDQGAERVAHLPVWVCDSGEGDFADETTAATPTRLLDWVVATSSGATPAGWQPPARALVESWLPQDGLSLQLDRHICTGDLVLGETRWTLRFDICSLATAMAPEQKQFLKEVLIPDADRLWKLVRFVWSPEADCERCSVEVDLSGAPHSEQLFRAAYEACAHAIRWLAPTAELLATATRPLQSILLSRQTHQPINPKERKHHDHK